MFNPILINGLNLLQPKHLHRLANLPIGLLISHKRQRKHHGIKRIKHGTNLHKDLLLTHIPQKQRNELRAQSKGPNEQVLQVVQLALGGIDYQDDD